MNKTHKINDLQIEIQDYHRDQLEKDGISLPPREETVLTLSGNFTQKDLDKAAKKGAKKQSTIAAPMIENPLPDATLTDAIATSDDSTASIELPVKEVVAGMNSNQAFAIAQQRGYEGKVESFRSRFEKQALGETFGLRRIPHDGGREKWLYFDTRSKTLT